MKVDGLPAELSLHSERNCFFYANLINARESGTVVEPSSTSISQYLRRFDELGRDERCQQLISESKRKMLSDREFQWLKSSDLVTDVAWMSLKDATHKDVRAVCNLQPPHEIFKKDKNDYFFESIVPEERHAKFDGRFSEIKMLFDFWDQEVFVKRKLMESVKVFWGDRRAQKLRLEWLNENDVEQCSWAWVYLQKNLPEECSRFFRWFSNPIDHKQECRAVKAILTFWETRSEVKELFLLKFRKAFDQKKYRERQVSRSPLNTYISHDRKRMLKKLSIEGDEKMYQTLERIIKKAYDEKFDTV